MISEEDKKIIKDMINDVVVKALKDITIKKSGDTPKEFFDLVNKGYLQLHGPRATTRPKATQANIGQMFYDTTGTGVPEWVGSDGIHWYDTNGNIIP